MAPSIIVTNEVYSLSYYEIVSECFKNPVFFWGLLTWMSFVVGGSFSLGFILVKWIISYRLHAKKKD